MTKFFRILFRAITFPFVLVYRIVRAPFILTGRAWRFLNTEPEESAFTETIAGMLSNEKIRQQVWDEVDTLRGHLLRSVIWLAIGTGISFLYTQQIINFLAIPVGGLGQLKAIEVTESVGVFMRAALLSGIILSFPFIAFEIWWFVAPGLRSRDRKFSLAAIPLGTILFLCGVAFTYFVMLPAALPILINFMGIQAELRPESYFGFITGLMFWIGLFFEFPLLVYVLTSIGLVKPSMLSHQWRLAVVIIAILAAAVTPTVDPVNMSLVMLPMILLYFVSVGLSYVAAALRGNKQPNEEKTPEQ